VRCVEARPSAVQRAWHHGTCRSSPFRRSPSAWTLCNGNRPGYQGIASLPVPKLCTSCQHSWGGNRHQKPDTKRSSCPTYTPYVLKRVFSRSVSAPSTPPPRASSPAHAATCDAHTAGQRAHLPKPQVGEKKKQVGGSRPGVPGRISGLFEPSGKSGVLPSPPPLLRPRRL
jgi:hypothetical protein